MGTGFLERELDAYQNKGNLDHTHSLEDSIAEGMANFPKREVL